KTPCPVRRVQGVIGATGWVSRNPSNPSLLSLRLRVSAVNFTSLNLRQKPFEIIAFFAVKLLECSGSARFRRAPVAGDDEFDRFLQQLRPQARIEAAGGLLHLLARCARPDGRLDRPHPGFTQ